MEVTRIEKVAKKIKACAYVRVSTKHNKQEESFETQMKYWETKLMNDPELDFVGIFSDEGISGRKTENRTGYLNMMRLVQAGEIDRIYVKSVSRFGRNKLESLRAIQAVRNKNAEIFFEKEQLNTSDPKCSLALTVMTTFAEAESESLSNNLKWSYQKKLERGELVFVRTFGYHIVNKKPQVNEEEAKWVRFIFESYVMKRKSPDEIAEELYRFGVKTHNGKWISKLFVQRILKNTMYVGDAVRLKTITINGVRKENQGEIKKYYFKNTHDAIVDRDLFEEAQTIKRAKKKNSMIKDIPICKGGILAKKIKCKNCGAYFKSTCDGLWFCPRYKQGCNITFLQETAVIEMIKKAISKHDDTISNSDPIISLDRKINEILRKNESLKKMCLLGNLDEIEYDMFLNALNEQYLVLVSKKERFYKRYKINYHSEESTNNSILKELKIGVVSNDKSIDVTLKNGFETKIKYPKLERSDYSWKF